MRLPDRGAMMVFPARPHFAEMSAEDRLGYIVANFYVWMARKAIAARDPTLLFPLDPFTGIEGLALQAVGDFWRPIIESRHQVAESEEDRARQSLGVLFVDTFYHAVINLQDRGMAEMVIVGGWPALRVHDLARFSTDPWAIGLLNEESAACAPAVGARLYQLASMSYREYLQTPEWREKRNQKVDEAGGGCQLCDQTGPLDVHHRTYTNRGHEPMTDLIVLCRGCHEMFHASGRQIGG